MEPYGSVHGVAFIAHGGGGPSVRLTILDAMHPKDIYIYVLQHNDTGYGLIQ